MEDTNRWAKAHRGMTGVFTVFDLPILGNITLRDKMIVKKWLSALILFGIIFVVTMINLWVSKKRVHY